MLPKVSILGVIGFEGVPMPLMIMTAVYNKRDSFF